MFNATLPREPFICEICEDVSATAPTMVIEANLNWCAPIQLCPACGAVDLDLMQLCRETTINCSIN